MATTITMAEFKALLEKAIPAGRRVLAVSPPGCGKTSGAEQVCESLDTKAWTINMPLTGPEFFAGYPYRGSDGTAGHAPFGVLAEALTHNGKGCIILDDVGSASESTIKAAFRFVQFRMVGDRQLGPDISIVGLSNDVTHGAGVNGLHEPMKDRFHTIVHLDYSAPDVVAYGMACDWDVGVLAYLNNGAQTDGKTAIPVFDWKPSRDLRRAGATPRGYEYASDWLKAGVEDRAVIEGCIGPGHATALLAFRALMKDLPDMFSIFADPDNAAVPENPSARYLVATAIAAKMDGGTFGQAVRYLNRLPKMLRILAVRDCRRAEVERSKLKIVRPDHRPLATSRDYTAWTLSADAKDLVGLS